MTNLIEPRTLSGFRDFLPEEAIFRSAVIEKIRRVFESFGFDPLETPALEYADVLSGKNGEEADKLLYTFLDRGERLIGLRYDQTVPVTRVVAQYPNIPKPFKRYQVQPVWRQEKPQKGRFREFLQCDADVFGETLSPLADAEIIQLLYSVLTELGFPKFKIKINSRQILFKLMADSGVNTEKYFSAIQSIDKLDKRTEEEVRVELAEKNFPNKVVDNIFERLKTQEPDDNLKEVFSYFDTLGVSKDYYQFEPTLSRGLDYYTGVIFEVKVEGYSAGSVAGGGRYDNLVGQFTGKQICAAGFALGFDRIIDALREQNLLQTASTKTKVLVTIFAPELLNLSLKITSELRNQGVNAEVYLDEKAKLDKQLKYADAKGIPYVIIVGPDEATKNLVTLKNFKDKSQVTKPLPDVIKLIREAV